MTTAQRKTIAHINEQLEAERFAAEQAATQGAALRGELGLDAQMRAMSAQARTLRAAGDEAGYQAMKAEAYKIYNGGN